MLKIVGASICCLLFIFLVIMGTNVPVVVYSESNLEYKQGYPQIQPDDVVGIFTHDGEKIPESEWVNVLSGRYEPIPATRE